MKTWFVLLAVMAIVISNIVFASEASASGLKTDIRFRGSQVKGRYQTPGGAVATVEDEKVLKNIFDVRRDFKDRVRKSIDEDR